MEFRAAVERHAAGDLPGAEQAYRAALAIADHLPSAHNLALLLDEMNRHVEARELFLRVVDLAPHHPRPHYSLANHYLRTGALVAAEAGFRRVLELDPQHETAPFDLGLALLSQERYAEGWPYYERRPARRAMLAQAMSFPEWRGEPLEGKRLFIWREQGFGDQIQAARFLRSLDAAAITYAGPMQLERLLRPLVTDYLVTTPGVATSIPPHDFWVLPMSLPARLGVKSQALDPAPYLAGAASGEASGLGICWHGADKNPNEAARRLPKTLADRLLALPGARSLHPEDTGARDFQDTADLIAGLKLVITTDTSVAHLAGAMGKPTWLLLAGYRVHWNWHWGRSDCPWYPSMRLFRQATPGQWEPVIDAVAQEAAALGQSRIRR